jgi:hypothetical protein
MQKPGPGTPQSAPQLIVKNDGTVHAIPEGITRIGRAPGNNIILDDSSVSRFQCYLVRQGTIVKIFDADESRNKTRLGKRQAHGQTLRHGHLLKVGRIKLIFRDPENVEAPTAVPAAPTPPTADPARQQASSLEQHESPGVPHEPASVVTPAHEESGVEPKQPGREAVASAGSSSRSRRRATSQIATLAPILILLLLCTVCGGVFLGIYVFGSGNGSATNTSTLGLTGTQPNELELLTEKIRALSGIVATLQSEIESEKARLQLMPLRIQNDIQRGLESFELRNDSLQVQRLDRIRRDLARIKEVVPLPEEDENDYALRALPQPSSADASGESDLEKAIAELENEPDESSTTTVRARTRVDTAEKSEKRLVPSTKKRVELTPRKINDLVNHLADTVDNFASPEATPKTLNPELESLTLALGEPAARGILKLESHARAQVERVDHNIAYLDKKITKLLRIAKRKTGDKKEGSSSKGYGRGSSPYELAQRDLELSAKKLEILKEQRIRLGSLYNTVLDAMIHFGDPGATKYLADRFATDDHLPLRMTILDVLAKHRAVHTIPVLVRKIRHRDEALRARVHQTLSAIVGEDLGDKSAPWLAWHKENVSK